MRHARIPLDGSDWKLLPLMPREWEWRRIWEKPEQVFPALWIPAVVPGTVQDDAQDAGLIPDWTKHFNSRACEWTSERDWVYLTEFETPDVPPDGIVRLHFEGVDYECHVFLNGQHLGDHEGIYDAFEYDITNRLNADGPNQLVVVVEHAPREVGQIGRTSEVRIWKARFAYDWDWCTRLVPIGIWDSVSLLVTGPGFIRDVQVHTHLADDLSAADVGIEVNVGALHSTPVTVATAVLFAGKKVDESTGQLLAAGATTTHSCRLRLDKPQLWWPNGYAGRTWPHTHDDEPLYQARIRLHGKRRAILDERTVTFGVRRVRAVSNDGAPEGALPYVLEVNGQKVFMKGWNWAPISQLYGRAGEREYERRLSLARQANVNLLRIWGGGLLEKEVFCDLCDRYGIMVWQEFIQSSSGIDNRPSTDPGYLRYIRRQAMKMIPRRRNHPSLVVWCGGNELMDDSHRPLNDSHPALAALKDTVKRLDPDRIWLPTSGSGPVANASVDRVGQMHDVHGPWKYLGPEEHYRFYNTIDPLLHAEFGVEGAANLQAMRKCASEELLWPPDESNPLWLHRGAWWIQAAMMERAFGKIEDLETYVRLSQFLQAEGLRYAIEANRRRKWHCAGTSPWQYNESWPNLSCTNVIDFYGQPRPAYWWCGNAYEPFHVSARYDKLGWKPGEDFQAEIWVNNSLAGEPDTGVSWKLFDIAGEELAGSEEAVDVPAGSAMRVMSAKWSVPALDFPLFILWVHAFSPSLRGSVNYYLFSTADEPIFAPLLNAPRTDLAASRVGGEVELTNVGENWALLVWFEVAEGGWMHFDCNHLFIAPGETLALSWSDPDEPVGISGLNFDELSV